MSSARNNGGKKKTKPKSKNKLVTHRRLPFLRKEKVLKMKKKTYYQFECACANAKIKRQATNECYVSTQK